MPANAVILGQLIQTDVDADMAAISGHHPLSQQDPSYFIEMCNAFGKGIADGSPSILFTTTDNGFEGTPFVPGAGTGIGIMVDSNFFAQDLYTRIRNYVIAMFGHTSYPPYPPPIGSGGQYLLALCQGIGDGIKSHFSTVWALTSTNPMIYSGTALINDGHYSGLVPTNITPKIIAAAPRLIGQFWPMLAQAVAESYVETIHNHSTGMLTIVGTCVPTLSQICGLSGSGTGSGAAA